MRIDLLNSTVYYVSIFVAIVMFATTILFLFEREKNAAIKASLFIPIFIGFAWLSESDFHGVHYFIISFLVVLIGVLVYIFFSTAMFVHSKEVVPEGRIDERNTMFSRNELKPGTERFDSYYNEFPDNRVIDDLFRKQSGLLSSSAAFYHPFTFAMADAGFYAVGAFKSSISGTPAIGEKKINREELDVFIRHWLRKRGVVSAGITDMKSYHWYSVGGRGERYGKKISLGLPLGIAFTVEMDEEMVSCAPYSPIVMESAQQYLNAGSIAVQLAAFLRNLGFEARAHIDGNYEVVCPLVARDAGLGEIGRMGLLMTPQLGPRVRLAVVTTDAPLITDKRDFDSSVEDFCSKCLKCAETCPSSAISFDDKRMIGNVKRWQINSEKCFTYWCSTGTDCGRCISVCPYSHPNNLFHNSVRFMIKYFPNFRKPAVLLDDFFYGRKPKPRKVPKWVKRDAER